jgi:hypothetical protein
VRLVWKQLKVNEPCVGSGMFALPSGDVPATGDGPPNWRLIMAVENGVLSYNGSMTFRSQPESFHYVFIGRPIKNGWPIWFPPLSPGRRGFRWRD